MIPGHWAAFLLRFVQVSEIARKQGQTRFLARLFGRFFFGCGDAEEGGGGSAGGGGGLAGATAKTKRKNAEKM